MPDEARHDHLPSTSDPSSIHPRPRDRGGKDGQDFVKHSFQRYMPRRAAARNPHELVIAFTDRAPGNWHLPATSNGRSGGITGGSDAQDRSSAFVALGLLMVGMTVAAQPAQALPAVQMDF
jgi:hypothetical protein